MFLIYLDNIDVQILVFSSVALISNIGLLTEEALSGEKNEKILPSTMNPHLIMMKSQPWT